MARRARFCLPDVPLHIVQRGNNRQPTFFSDDDRVLYLECLRQAAERNNCDVHAYVLMKNHVHLLVTPYTSNGASRLMQALGSRYVWFVNQLHGRTGTLWEGRFRASLIESEAYLLTCYRYIELNPVRAHLVNAPDEYRWSSYRHHVLGVEDGIVRDHPLYLGLGETQQERSRVYHELVQQQLQASTLHEIRKSLNDDTILGSKRFEDLVTRASHRLIRRPVRGRPRKHALDKHAENASDPISCG
jgi:putative transposase